MHSKVAHYPTNWNHATSPQVRHQLILMILPSSVSPALSVPGRHQTKHHPARPSMGAAPLDPIRGKRAGPARAHPKAPIDQQKGHRIAREGKELLAPDPLNINQRRQSPTICRGLRELYVGVRRR